MYRITVVGRFERTVYVETQDLKEAMKIAAEHGQAIAEGQRSPVQKRTYGDPPPVWLSVPELDYGRHRDTVQVADAEFEELEHTDSMKIRSAAEQKKTQDLKRKAKERDDAAKAKAKDDARAATQKARQEAFRKGIRYTPKPKSRKVVKKKGLIARAVESLNRASAPARKPRSSKDRSAPARTPKRPNPAAAALAAKHGGAPYMSRRKLAEVKRKAKAGDEHAKTILAGLALGNAPAKAGGSFKEPLSVSAKPHGTLPAGPAGDFEPDPADERGEE